MERQERREQILNILAAGIRKVLLNTVPKPEELQEIRMRLGQPLRVVRGKEEIVLRSGTEPYIVTKEELRETMDYISHYSLYAYENELRQGFVTVEGGHRVGVAGKVIMEKERVKNIQYISSLNIRVSHEVLGCADRLIPYIVANKQVCHTLIISPPCCGKTTLIRDLIRQISDGNEYVKGCSVGVVDERSELGGCYLGIAQNHLGTRTDVLDCCPKAEGMIMLIRSMSPQVIAVDEIGTVEDIHAIEYAMQCGCRMIASVHGLNMDEASNKPVLGDLIRRRMFQRYVVLGNEKDPVRSWEFMMNGGACCAETYREHFSADGNCRSRLSLWGRTERLSQADGISAIYCRDDPGTTGIYRGTVAGTSDGCISENKRAI